MSDQEPAVPSPQDDADRVSPALPSASRVFHAHFRHLDQAKASCQAASNTALSGTIRTSK